MRLSTHKFSVCVPLALLAACSNASSQGGAASTAVAPSTSATTTIPVPVVPSPAGPVRNAPANLLTGPSLVLDASGQASFFDLPYPLDARLRANGAPDLALLPNPRGVGFVKSAIEVAAQDVKGFSPTGPIYFRFDDVPNAPKDDPYATVQPGSAVFVVDVDARSPERLSRHPVHLALSPGDSVRPANLLQVLPVPGLGLRPGTTYAAIVLRSLGSPKGPWLGQAPGLTRLLTGAAPVGSGAPALAKAYAPLPAALKDLGIHPDDVAAATVFTTGDPAARVHEQVAFVNRRPALSPFGPLEVRDQYPDFTAIRGFYEPDQFQVGIPPFPIAPWGRLALDGNGMPFRQSSQRAEFQLSIPKGKMPAAGFPLYFYVHGTGGYPSQAIDRGRFSAPGVPSPPGQGIAMHLAPRGWATSCAAGPLSPSRLGFLSAQGYAAYDFFNPAAMRDNFLQMIFEQVEFRNLLMALRIDPKLCPGTDASASPDGKVRFDARHVVVSGQSLGSYLSGMLASTLDGFQGAVLTGAGGSWVEFAFGPKDPVDLQLVIEFLALAPGEKLDRFHPFIAAFELAVGPADNTHYVSSILRKPRPGRTVPNVLVIEGHGDLQVPDNLQRALLLGVGVDLGNPDVGVANADRVDWIVPLGGRQCTSLPVQGNVLLPSGERRTGVACRYEKDGIMEGHYVVVQLDAPKRQIGEFCEAIAKDQLPLVK